MSLAPLAISFTRRRRHSLDLRHQFSLTSAGCVETRPQVPCRVGDVPSDSCWGTHLDSSQRCVQGAAQLSLVKFLSKKLDIYPNIKIYQNE